MWTEWTRWASRAAGRGSLGALVLALCLVSAAPGANAATTIPDDRPSSPSERPKATRLTDRIDELKIDEPLRLDDFLKRLGERTDFRFDVGVRNRVTIVGDYSSQTLRTVLDRALKPRGLGWEDQGRFIFIDADLRERFYPLDFYIVPTIAALLERGELQRILWGQSGMPPVDGGSIILDARLRQVAAKDSLRNLDHLGWVLTAFAEPPAEATAARPFPFDPEVAALAQVIVDAHLMLPGAFRGTRIRGGTLVVRDTAANLAKAEEILFDDGLFRRLIDGRTRLGVWGASRFPGRAPAPFERDRFWKVVEAVEALLYPTGDTLNSRREGRWFWANPKLLTLTIVDTPENLQAVSKRLEELRYVPLPGPGLP